jgi:hypothetical protein
VRWSLEIDQSLGNDRELDSAVLGATLSHVVGGNRVIGTRTRRDDPIAGYTILHEPVFLTAIAPSRVTF